MATRNFVFMTEDCCGWNLYHCELRRNELLIYVIIYNLH